MNDKEYLSELGKRIAIARKHKGLTQEQLAEFAGVSIKVVQKLETGTNATRSHNLASIIKVLEEDSNFILFGHKKFDLHCGICEDYNSKIDKLSADQFLLLCSVLDNFFKALESKNPFGDAEQK